MPEFCMLAPSEMISHEDFKYPVIVQPKYDGVRALLIDKVFYSRNMKPIRNKSVQLIAKGLPNWTTNFVLDGEWWAPSEDFNTIQSIIMDSDDPLPQHFVHVSWDCMGSGQWGKRNCDRLYVQRFEELGRVQRRLQNDNLSLAGRFERSETAYLGNPFTFARHYSQLLAHKQEGAMVKAPNGLYKWGRCTVREAIMLKYKPTFDIDVKVKAVEEGKGKRVGCAAAIMAVVNGVEVRFGPGKEVTEDYMRKLWKRRKEIPGRVIDCYHSGITPDGSFRFPKYKTIRLDK